MAKASSPRAFLIALLMLVLTAATASSASRSIASTDRLPLGDWTYDAMMSLAADGLTPGMSARTFQGERRFSRMEMAEVIASVLSSPDSDHFSPKQAALLRHLVAEFRPEIAETNPAVAEEWSGEAAGAGLSAGRQAFLIGYMRDIASDGGLDSDESYTAYRASGFLCLSDSSFGIFTLADREERFFHEPRNSTNLDKALIVGRSGDVSWLVGRSYANWGPAYGGSLILSDNAPAFWQVRGAADVNLGKLLGTVKITQFGSMFEDFGENLYLFGRRYEKRLSDRLHLGVSETAKMNTSPDPLIMVMPLYLYQHLFSRYQVHMNNLAGFDLCYRMPSGVEAYVELMVDDMAAPKILNGAPGRPQKTGHTVGLSVPNVISGRRYSSLTAEYTAIDRLTYEATRESAPELVYTHDTHLIGHPLGPNSRALYLRGEYSVSDRMNLIGEYLRQRPRDPGAPEVGFREHVSLTVGYDIAPDKSLTFRAAPYRVTPADSATESGTTFELRASFAF